MNVKGASLLPKASDAIMIRRASDSMALGERDILTRERALKVSASGSSHTTYRYEIGPDGRRYIVGAEVSITAPEDELRGIPGAKISHGASHEPARHSQVDPNQAEIAHLQQTEREVVAHENAHKAAAGRFGGPIRYTYTTGPDGKLYITGGEVSIKTPATSDPEEALRNARQVMSAAMAPGSPSGQDIAVAARAAAMASDATARISSSSGEKIERGYADFKSPKGLWSKNFGFETPDADNGRDLLFTRPMLDIPA
jgi:hypothetical protein